MRTTQSRLLLRPSPEFNKAIAGVLGRALYLYEVNMHAFAFMSNHFHLLVSPANAGELVKFMAHVNRNISAAIGRLHDWKGASWHDRYHAIVIADEASQVARLRYILEQGCKEGLVETPRDWPGLHCVNALVDGVIMSGTWIDRSAFYEARRGNNRVKRSDFERTYPIRLSPLPCWRALTESEHRKHCAALVSLIEDETAANNAELGRRPMGAAFVLALNPHSKPRSSSTSPRPLVHAASKKVRKLFHEAYRRFVDAFRHAAERLRQGEHDVLFPLHSFPPARPYVSTPGKCPGLEDLRLFHDHDVGARAAESLRKIHFFGMGRRHDETAWRGSSRYIGIFMNT